MTHPFTIIIPHYKTGRMTAYTLFKILQDSKDREIHIIVVDNSNGEGLEYLKPFEDKIQILSYPPERMQSHGIAYDYAMSIVRTEWFITLESDSYPTEDGWLDYYDKIIDSGYDSAGSLLPQSGGLYLHPAGALYRKSVYCEAKKYTDSIDYAYFPNIAVKDDPKCMHSSAATFGYHLMVKNSILLNFMVNPKMYIKLHHSYKKHDPDSLVKALDSYKPVTGVFHNGMGDSQESLDTYTQRNIYTEPSHILLSNESDIVYRVGMEPGQHFCYWQLAVGKKLFYIPTEIKWLPNRHGQQQEYTLMENGVRHEWGMTAYNGCAADELQDIVRVKESTMNELYESLPKNVRI